MPRSFRKSTAAPKPDGLGDRGSASLELGGQLGAVEAVEAHVEDHVAATEERWHRFQQFFATPQHADARRPAHLVAAERDEVGVPRLHVGGVVRHVLARIDNGDRAGSVRRGAQLLHRSDGAHHVAHRREAEHLGTLEQLGQVGQIELAVGGQRHPAQARCPCLAPAFATGTMLAWCSMCVSTHDVASVQIGATPRVSDQVQRLGRVLREDDFVRTAGIDEVLHLLACTLVTLRWPRPPGDTRCD